MAVAAVGKGWNLLPLNFGRTIPNGVKRIGNFQEKLIYTKEKIIAKSKANFNNIIALIFICFV